MHLADKSIHQIYLISSHVLNIQFCTCVIFESLSFLICFGSFMPPSILEIGVAHYPCLMRSLPTFVLSITISG